MNTAYLAGIFDGEGSVLLSQRTGTTSYELRLVVVNTHPAPLLLLRQEFGGTINKKPTRSDWHRQAWSWQVSGDKAREALKRMLPYLLVKKVQAEIAIAFKQGICRANSWFPAPPEELALRRGFQLAIQEANAGGNISKELLGMLSSKE